MTDVVFTMVDAGEADYHRKEKESDTISGHVTKVPYVIDADTNASLGATTDAAASVSTDEDTTARSLVALAKGLKNLQIDIKTLLETTGIAFLPIDKDIDDIDVAKMSAGAVTTHHNAITAAVTLANTVEVDCRGFNSMRVHLNIDTTDKSCVFGAYGAMGSGLTFVPHLDSAGAAIVYTTSISGWYIITGICDYMKIVPSTVTSGATVTCKVQPFNS